jgi:uncharacterized membrane protein YphA (DoxX/SURF4 family)
MKRAYSGNHLASLLIRLGLAIVFLYAAVSSLMHPLLWSGYLPGFAAKLADPVVLVRILAVYEIILAAWLLIGKFTRYAAALTVLTFAGILVTNMNQFIITFRDIGLLFAALALLFLDDKA